MEKYKYKGSRWYKCDLHLHTYHSDCYKDDKDINTWIENAIEEELDCVAITDHNTSHGIDEFKYECEKHGIIAFPGVEITCDTSKIHLLILFDVDKDGNDIRDFLVRADIKSQNFGLPTASTTTNIFDIIDLANTDGAIVIPAHIDEYSGLGSISHANLKKVLQNKNINAVQVVHEEFCNTSVKIQNNDELKARINEFHAKEKGEIDEALLKQWYAPVKEALEAKCSILTFSDNPKEDHSPEHGVWGIGKRYTYIKMGETPTLEGLRQAFLLPDFRIRNDFIPKSKPSSYPQLWIKSISVKNTAITEDDSNLNIEFSPQLTTIIGGRGSGKSSVLRFIRGVFNKIVDIENLEDILKDHNEFYKRATSKDIKGVLNEDTVIEVQLYRYEKLFRITATNIVNSENQEILIEEKVSDEWNEVTGEGFIDFFEFEHYSQKQIYEIAQEPNALRERIDSSDKSIQKLKNERHEKRQNYLEVSTRLRTLNQLSSSKGKLETVLKDINANIERLQESGIAEILKQKQIFENEKTRIKIYRDSIEYKIKEIKEFNKQILINQLDENVFSEKYQDLFEEINKEINSKFLDYKNKANRNLNDLESMFKRFKSKLRESSWLTDYRENINEFNEKKKELSDLGVDDFDVFEEFLKDKRNCESEIQRIEDQIKDQPKLLKERQEVIDRLLKISLSISKLRSDFVDEVLKEGNVRIKIGELRNSDDFESQIRKIIQRENSSFQNDIDMLRDYAFHGKITDRIIEFRLLIHNIRNSEEIDISLTKQFKNLIMSLNDEQIDEFDILIPEDKIEVLYKPNPDSEFKSLSTASAGQKTTAILTFILSFGLVPLILDQPEDDLDNKLVYELIVESLLLAKQKRQIIIVTHNANVPVNGDAEYIISMNSNTDYVETFVTGSVDQESMKNEICEVMEGGIRAFKMRSKRYLIK